MTFTALFVYLYTFVLLFEFNANRHVFLVPRPYFFFFCFVLRIVFFYESLRVYVWHIFKILLEKQIWVIAKWIICVVNSQIFSVPARFKINFTGISIAYFPFSSQYMLWFLLSYIRILTNRPLTMSFSHTKTSDWPRLHRLLLFYHFENNTQNFVQTSDEKTQSQRGKTIIYIMIRSIILSTFH